MSSTTTGAPAATTTGSTEEGSAQSSEGMGLVAFLTALATSLVVFGIQMGFFLLLRNKLARILCVNLTGQPTSSYPSMWTSTDIALCSSVNQKHSSYPNENEQTRRRQARGACSSLL